MCQFPKICLAFSFSFSSKYFVILLFVTSLIQGLFRSMWFSFQILRVFQRSFCALASYDLLGVSRGTLRLRLLFTVLEGRPCWLPCSFCWYLGVFPAWLMRIDRIPGTEWAPVICSYSLFRWFLPGLRWFLPDGRYLFLCWMPKGLLLRSPGSFSSLFYSLLSTVLICDICPLWFHQTISFITSCQGVWLTQLPFLLPVLGPGNSVQAVSWGIP